MMKAAKDDFLKIYDSKHIIELLLEQRTHDMIIMDPLLYFSVDAMTAILIWNLLRNAW